MKRSCPLLSRLNHMRVYAQTQRGLCTIRALLFRFLYSQNLSLVRLIAISMMRNLPKRVRKSKTRRSKKKKLRRRQMKQKRGHGEQIAVIPLRFVCTRGRTLSPCSTGKAILSITLLRHGHLVPLLCALGHITRREKYRRLLGELPEKKGTIQPAEKFFTNTHMKKFAAGLIEKMRMVRSNVHFPNCLVTCKK